MNGLSKGMMGNDGLLLFFIIVFLGGCASQTESSRAPQRTDTNTQEIESRQVRNVDTATRTELIETGAPDSAMKLLRSREGFEDVVYVGANGRHTAGLGHVLLESEMGNYLLNTLVPDHILEQWMVDDTQESWVAAVNQAFELGEMRLAEPLFAVNFQLGIFWYTVHKNTWSFLQQGDWQGASREIMDSSWCRQTPLRCEDFEQALLAL